MTTDDALLARLGSAFAAVDPVPPAALTGAIASLSWRDPDAALAELVTDSLVAPAGVRSGPGAGPRLLTFEAAELSVEVEVTDVGQNRRLIGQLVPPQQGDVDVRWCDGNVRVSADTLGRFSVESVPSGPVSLACRLANRAGRVVTSWIAI